MGLDDARRDREGDRAGVRARHRRHRRPLADRVAGLSMAFPTDNVQVPRRSGWTLSAQEWRVLGYFWPHRKAMIFAVFCATVAGLTSTAPVGFLKRFGDTIFTDGDPDDLARLAAAVVLLAVAGATGQYCQMIILRNGGYQGA